jgi:23S rRNA (cytidine2498-2'-O)-methyltransferase
VLKAELGAVGASPAFMRPGLLTVKRGPDRPQFSIDPPTGSVFARRIGLSHGLFDDPVGSSALRAVADRADRVGLPARLQVCARVVEENAGDIAAEVAQVDAALRAALPDHFLPDEVAQEGEVVIDLVRIDPGRWLLGSHRQHSGELPHPGGAFTPPIPAAAPSRSYRKLREALGWSGFRLAPGDLALELGSAPGGTAFALLEAGLEVIGVDAAEMDPGVAAHPRFRHLQKPAERLAARDLPGRVDWILTDMNVEPQVALAYVEGLIASLAGPPLGVLLTLKLNRWALAELLPDFLTRVERMGVGSPRAKQLASHRQELLLCGLTERGLSAGRSPSSSMPRR